MAGILVYALHDDEGNFNKNSLGAISEAAKLAGEVGGEAAALVVGDVADDACASLGNYGAAKVYRAKSVPEGLAQPIVDAMAKVIGDEGFSYALFGGGRGLGAKEGFELCEQLADSMGGAVAATRAVVDAGWYPYAAQIGQTGKTVAPKLYLAAGVSGAIQHKVGMQNSENILAINKDPNAPIFEFSDLGVVGDLHKIVPKLTEAIKAKKGG